jgi:4-amino-4-deoxy-L-arabinose transferase-like glycosyltransferase
VLLKGAVWALSVPLLDGPDESKHLSSARSLAFHLSTSTDVAVAHSLDERRLWFGIMAVSDGYPAARFYVERAPGGQDGSTEKLANGYGTPRAGFPSDEYGPLTYVPYLPALILTRNAGITAQLTWARMTSALIGALAALAAFWAAREAGLSRALAAAAAVLAGFEPMWSQQTAILSADAGSLLWSALVLALVLRFLRKRTPGSAILGTVCLGIGVLSKPAVLFVFPLVFLFTLPLVSRRAALRLRLASLLLGEAFIGAGYLAFNRFMLTHGPWGSPTVRIDLGSFFAAAGRQGWGYARGILDSFLGTFEWLNLPMAPPVLHLTSAIVGVLLVASVVALVRARSASRVALAVCYSFLIFALAAAVLFDVGAYPTAGALLAQGRYVLPALPALAILSAVGLEAVMPRRHSWAAAPVLIVLAVSFNMAGLATLWGRFYVA